MYVYMFISFGLACPKAQKATYHIVPTGYSGDLDELEGDQFISWNVYTAWVVTANTGYFVT